MCVTRYRAWQLCCHRTDPKTSTETCEAAAYLPRGVTCRRTHYEPIIVASGLCPRCSEILLQVNDKWRALGQQGAGERVMRAAEFNRDDATERFYKHWQDEGPDHDGAQIYQLQAERAIFSVEITVRLMRSYGGSDPEPFSETAYWAFYNLTDKHKGLESLNHIDYRRVMMMTWQIIDMSRIALYRDGWVDRLQQEMLTKCEHAAIRLGIID
ncbi:hypothetical protein F5X96DRAFT_674196 [Biscogniauxia mediterranea]|nr:hypothetical protein F5X96DRAFT_674196 [Biscogniauxia mediterranea]